MKNKTAYILYQYNEFKNDYEYVFEYYSIKELQQDNPQIESTARNIYNSISKSLDHIKRVVNNRYIIISETIEEEGARE